MDSNEDGVIDLNKIAEYLNKTEEVKSLINGDSPQCVCVCFYDPKWADT